jgi:hypothetical protein
VISVVSWVMPHPENLWRPATRDGCGARIALRDHPRGSKVSCPLVKNAHSRHSLVHFTPFAIAHPALVSIVAGLEVFGAEMMRLAACLATERGIQVCCPVHDAFLIEANADQSRVRECQHSRNYSHKCARSSNGAGVTWALLSRSRDRSWTAVFSQISPNSRRSTSDGSKLWNTVRSSGTWRAIAAAFSHARESPGRADKSRGRPVRSTISPTSKSSSRSHAILFAGQVTIISIQAMPQTY